MEKYSKEEKVLKLKTLVSKLSLELRHTIEVLNGRIASIQNDSVPEIEDEEIKKLEMQLKSNHDQIYKLRIEYMNLDCIKRDFGYGFNEFLN